MTAPNDRILDEVLALLTQLAGDWEYSGTITPETHLLSDLGMESLALVVLGTSLQERYGRLPFAEFLVEIGQRPQAERDITVRELVEFVGRHAQSVPAGEAP
jgi:acyl carrier protein